MTTDSGYDNLGRITAVDAGTTLAKFRYTYVSNEHNIDRQYLDPLAGGPYNRFVLDAIDRIGRKIKDQTSKCKMTRQKSKMGRTTR